MTDSKANREESETGRVEAFSDGVFAIAITLLILDIKVPPGERNGDRLLYELLGTWPSMLAYVSSFATIGIMWINHHRLFTLIRRVDQRLLILNLMLLGGVTFVPFPTSFLAQYYEHRMAAIFYTGTFVLIAIIFNALWHYASRGHRLLDAAVDPEAVKAITRQYALGPIVYLACFALAFVNVLAAIGLTIALAIYFAIEPRKASVWHKPLRHLHRR